MTRVRRVRSGASLCASVALLLLVACAPQEWRFDTHRARAERYVESDEVDAALLELYSALRIHPDHPDVNFQIAELASRKLDVATAKFFYREAHEADPTHVEATIKYALLLFADDPQRGAELVQEMIDLDAENPWSSIGLSEFALVRGDSFLALEAAQDAVRNAPDSSAARWQLVRVHLAMIRERSLVGQPVTDELLQDTEDAIAEFTKRSPKDAARALVERARVSSVSPERRDETARLFESAIHQARFSEREELIRYAAREALDFARASGPLKLRLYALRVLTRVDADDMAVWAELSRVVDHDRQIVFDRLLRERPDDPAARLLIVRERIDQDGIDWAKQFLESEAEAGIEPTLLLGHLADLQLQHGRIDEWEATSHKLIEEYPLHPRSRVARAHLLLSRPPPGMRARDAAEDAAEILRPIVETEFNPDALRLLAIAESRLENYARSLYAIDRLIASVGPNLELVRLHAMLLHDAGYWRFALTLFEWVQKRDRLTDAERLMAGRCAYNLGDKHSGRLMLLALLRRPQPMAEAAVELARHENLGQRFRPRVLQALDAALDGGERDVDTLALATSIDLENGQRARALERIDRQLGREITTGAAAQRAAHEAKGRDRERALDEVKRTRNRISGLAHFVVGLELERAERERLADTLATARSAGLINPSAHAWFGRLELLLGQEREARASFERALAGGFDDPDVKSELALLLAHNGIQLDRALDLAKQSVTANETGKSVDTLGLVRLRRGEAEAALVQFDRAVELGGDEHRAEFEYHRGLALFELGNVAGAAEAFDAALAHDPQFSNAAQARDELRRGDVPGKRDAS